MHLSRSSRLAQVVGVFILLSSLTVSAKTDSTATPLRGNNQLGIRFSNLTGYGTSYQRNFGAHYAARLTSWFKYYEYIKGDEATRIRHKKTNNNYNFGLDIQRNVISENGYRVFADIGGGYAVSEQVIEVETIQDPNNLKHTLVTGGLGGGIEYFMGRRMSADMAIYYKFDYDINERRLKEDNESVRETGLGISLGLNICF